MVASWIFGCIIWIFNQFRVGVFPLSAAKAKNSAVAVLPVGWWVLKIEMIAQLGPQIRWYYKGPQNGRLDLDHPEWCDSLTGKLKREKIGCIDRRGLSAIMKGKHTGPEWWNSNNSVRVSNDFQKLKKIWDWERKQNDSRWWKDSCRSLNGCVCSMRCADPLPNTILPSIMAYVPRSHPHRSPPARICSRQPACNLPVNLRPFRQASTSLRCGRLWIYLPPVDSCTWNIRIDGGFHQRSGPHPYDYRTRSGICESRFRCWWWWDCVWQREAGDRRGHQCNHDRCCLQNIGRACGSLGPNKFKRTGRKCCV